MAISTREANTAFADLVYTDQQWVDAEFDALISASFSEPPAPPAAPSRVPPHPGTPPPPSRQPAPGQAAAIISPAIRLSHGRQRSPPAHPLAVIRRRPDP
jgi:hypothetical protein